MKKKLIIISIAIILLGIAGGIGYYKYQEEQEKIYKQKQKELYQSAKKNFQSLYENHKTEFPKESLTTKDIEKVEKEVENITYEKEKNLMLSKLKELKEYLLIKEKLLSYFDGEILKSTTTLEMIDEITEEYKKLPANFQTLLIKKIELMLPQYNNMQNAIKEVNSLFTDDQKTIVRQDINRNNYNSAVNAASKVIQPDIAGNLKNLLNVVNDNLTKREEAERRRLAELAERERQRKEREIAAAWHILNVPYISQNKNNVLNGCEVASLLMGLKYKGYLKEMTLKEYAENVPKSSDPFQGFTYSIFELAPNTVPHWIAPAPLALYGKTSSGANVIDATGTSLENLDKEVMAGNPVVIYLTSKFNPPKQYIEGAPKNIHVLLLTGYNHITKVQVITDPWTHNDGTTKWYMSKEKIENIYNATGKRSVIIK